MLKRAGYWRHFEVDLLPVTMGPRIDETGIEVNVIANSL